MNTILMILAIAFGVVFILILASSLLTSAWLFQMFSRTARNADGLDSMENPDADQAERIRALELVSKIPPNQEAWKCRNCGAIVDSTAELTAGGKVKCNYCNSWSSIYQ